MLAKCGRVIPSLLLKQPKESHIQELPKIIQHVTMQKKNKLSNAQQLHSAGNQMQIMSLVNVVRAVPYTLRATRSRSCVLLTVAP